MARECFGGIGEAHSLLPSQSFLNNSLTQPSPGTWDSHFNRYLGLQSSTSGGVEDASVQKGFGGWGEEGRISARVFSSHPTTFRAAVCGPAAVWSARVREKLARLICLQSGRTGGLAGVLLRPRAPRAKQSHQVKEAGGSSQAKDRGKVYQVALLLLFPISAVSTMRAMAVFPAATFCISTILYG